MSFQSLKLGGSKRKKSWKSFKDNSSDDRWDKDLDYLDVKPNEYMTIRLVGDYFVGAQHWIEFTNAQKKNKRFPEWCPNFDAEIEDFVSDRGCPYCEMGIYAPKRYLSPVIVREIQEQGGSQSPVKVARFGVGVARQISKIVDLNKHTVDGKKGTYPVDDPEHGCDIHLFYDPSAQGVSKYVVQKGDPAPLTQEEMAYKYPDITAMYSARPIEQLLRDVGRLTIVDGDGNVLSEPTRKTSFGGSAATPPPAKPKVMVDDDDDDDMPAPAAQKKSLKLAETPPAKTSLGKKGDDDISGQVPKEVEEAKPAPPTQSNAAMKPSVGGGKVEAFCNSKNLSTKSFEGETVPECFADFDGSLKCFQCPTKTKCTESTQDDDDDDL